MSAKQRLGDLMKEVPDFPKKGINFFDLNTIFNDPEHFQSLVVEMGKLTVKSSFEKIVGIESRGFIIGAALAHHLKLGFVPLRKSGKLPPPVIRESYSLEYGKDSLEIQPGQGKVLIVDDVLATGGTLGAAASLCEKAGYSVEKILVFLDLKTLNQFEWRGLRAESLVQR